MKIEYFEDTDTLQITLNEEIVVDSKDIDENILGEFDQDGHLVTMTIEHAKDSVNVETLLYQKVS